MAKVKIIIDLSKDSQEDLDIMLRSLHGLVVAHGIKNRELTAQSSTSSAPVTTAESAQVPIKEEKAPVIPAKKEAAPKSETAAAPAAAAPVSQPPAPSAQSASSTVTIKELRALVGKLVNTHRDEIKAKLTELGANNISNLGLEHYETMFDFLINLDE